MKNRYADFAYRPLVEVPQEFRQLDWTYIKYYHEPFSEAEIAFQQLKEEVEGVFAHHPFLYLHFLRGVEGRLLSLAMRARQPLAKCLEYLRRRLDLEYSRGDISGKTAEAVLLGDYALDCGEPELARKLLTEERAQLEEALGHCQAALQCVMDRLEKLAE